MFYTATSANSKFSCFDNLRIHLVFVVVVVLVAFVFIMVYAVWWLGVTWRERKEKMVLRARINTTWTIKIIIIFGVDLTGCWIVNMQCDIRHWLMYLLYTHVRIRPTARQTNKNCHFFLSSVTCTGNEWENTHTQHIRIYIICAECIASAPSIQTINIWILFNENANANVPTNLMSNMMALWILFFHNILCENYAANDICFHIYIYLSSFTSLCVSVCVLNLGIVNDTDNDDDERWRRVTCEKYLFCIETSDSSPSQ